MALFENEPLVNINGMMVPASVAAQFQGGGDLGLTVIDQSNIHKGNIGGILQPPPPPPPPPPQTKVGSSMPGVYSSPDEVLGMAPPPGVASVTGQAAPVADPNAVSPSQGDFKAGTGETAAKEIKARAAPVKGKPAPTPTEGLQQDGYGGALNDQEGALGGIARAQMGTATAESLGQEAVAGTIAQRNAEIDKKVAAKQQAAQADLFKIEKVNADFEAGYKKFANTKIDRSIDHPVMAGIGAILSGLGMAMMGRGADENPAIKALYTAIDRKVAGQMQDLDKQGKALGMQKEHIQGLRSLASDKQAFHNLLIAGETEKAARVMEEIGARTTVETIKTKALEGAAALRLRAADYKMAAVDKQVDSDHKTRDRQEREASNKRQVGLGYLQLKEGARQFDAEQVYKREKMDADLAGEIARANAAGKTDRAKLFADAAKMNNERGVGDPAGNYLLQPQGKKMMQEADKLEAQAAKVAEKNPQAAEVMRQKASGIRAEVLADENNGVWRMGSNDASAKMATTIADGGQAVKLMQEIKQLAAANGKEWLTTTVGRATIQAKVTALTMRLKNAWGLGVLSKQDTALISQGTSGDPTTMDAKQLAFELTDGIIGTDGEGYQGRLDALSADIKGGILKSARRNKFRGDAKDFFDADEKVADTDDADYRGIYKDKTTDEALEGASGKGVAGSAKRGAQNLIYGHDDHDAINSKGEFEGSALTKDAAESADRLIARAKGGDQKAIDLLRNAVDDPNKPAHAGAIGAKVREKLPEVYKTTQASKQQVDPNRELPMIDGRLVRIEDLASAATIDQASFAQLAKIAGQGDPYAKKLLEGVTNHRARR